MAKPVFKHPVFGLLAEFSSSQDLIRAIDHARGLGYSKLEAYTPMPIHAVTEALGHKNRLPLVVLCGGVLGAVGGYLMQYWISVHAYPLNVGGRPLNSWPSFMIVTFEMTILCAALSAVLGMLALNGLPRPHHPVFAVPGFELASRNRFFLLVPHYDPLFDRKRVREMLDESNPLSTTEVPH